MRVGYRVRVTDGQDMLSGPRALAQSLGATLRGLGVVCNWPQLYAALMGIRASQGYIDMAIPMFDDFPAIFDEKPYNINQLALMFRIFCEGGGYNLGLVCLFQRNQSTHHDVVVLSQDEEFVIIHNDRRHFSQFTPADDANTTFEHESPSKPLALGGGEAEHSRNDSERKLGATGKSNPRSTDGKIVHKKHNLNPLPEFPAPTEPVPANISPEDFIHRYPNHLQGERLVELGKLGWDSIDVYRHLHSHMPAGAQRRISSWTMHHRYKSAREVHARRLAGDVKAGARTVTRSVGLTSAQMGGNRPTLADPAMFTMPAGDANERTTAAGRVRHRARSRSGRPDLSLHVSARRVRKPQPASAAEVQPLQRTYNLRSRGQLRYQPSTGEDGLEDAEEDWEDVKEEDEDETDEEEEQVEEVEENMEARAEDEMDDD